MTGKTMVSCCYVRHAKPGLLKLRHLLLCLTAALFLLWSGPVWADAGGTITESNDNNYTLDTGSNTFRVDDSATYELSGLFDGTGNFIKMGPGGLFLSNTSNSYTGSTRVSQGLLQIADWNAIDADNEIYATNGGQLVSNADLRIGDAGTGSLSVKSNLGGSLSAPSAVTANNIYIGYGAGSFGNVLVETDNTLTANNNLYVGYDGAGVLRGNGNIVAGTVNVNERGAISPGDKDGEIGTLNIDGDANFDGATLVIDLDDTADQKADLIAVSGNLTFGSNTNTIDIGTWSDGAYVIATAGNIAQNGRFDYTYQGGALTVRQYAVAGLNGDGDKLLLGTHTKNLNLMWNNANSTWDNSALWDVIGSDNVQETFLNDDYVVFDVNSGLSTITITDNVTVSGMMINGGQYVFQGAQIAGTLPSEDNHQVVSGRLDILGDSSVAFQNIISFSQGMYIAGGSTVTLNTGGSFSGTAITNSGNLVFDGYDIGHNGAIAGTGNTIITGTATSATLNGGSYTTTGLLDHREGVLLFNGSWGGSYVQEAGAMLSGPGTDNAGSMTLAGSATLKGFTYLNGNITAQGNIVMHGDAYIYLDLRNAPTASTINTSGTLSVTEYASEKITLDFNTWWRGEHVIMTAAGGISSDFLTAVELADVRSSKRMASSLKISDDATQLILVNTVDSRNLIWTGTTSNRWQANLPETTKNWVENVTGRPDEIFVKWDYVTFNAEGVTKDITVQDYTDSSVQFAVAGMEVTGGEYIFTGIGNDNPTLYGLTEVDEGQKLTAKLEIKNDAKVSFQTLALNFENGVSIAREAQVTMLAGASFAAARAVENNGLIVFNYDTGTASYGSITTGIGNFTKLGNTQLNFTANALGTTGLFSHEAGNVNFSGSWGGNYVQTEDAGTFTANNGANIAGGFTQELGAGSVTINGTVTIGGVATFNGPKTDENDSSLNLNTGTLNVQRLNINGTNINTTFSESGSTINYGKIATGTGGYIIAGDDKNTIDISKWYRGEYLLISGTTNFTDVYTKFNEVLVNGLAAPARIHADLEIRASGIWLVNSVDNLDIHWTGNNTENKTWAMGVEDNWEYRPSSGPAQTEEFTKWDYVIFEDLGREETITVLADAADFEIAGMEITGGEYIFKAGNNNATIWGIDDSEDDNQIQNDQSMTGALAISGSAEVTFEVGLNFNKGITIASDSQVTIGGSYGSFTTSRVENEGLIIYDVASGSSKSQSGIITGGGDITKTGAGTLSFAGDAGEATGLFTQNAGNVTFTSTGKWGGDYIQNGGDFTGTGSTISGNFTQIAGAGKVTANNFTIGKNASFDGTAQQAETDFTANLELTNVLNVHDTATLHNSNISITLNAQTPSASGKIVANQIVFSGDAGSKNVVNLTAWQSGTFEIFSALSFTGINDYLDSEILLAGKALVANRQIAELAENEQHNKIILTTSINNVNLIWQDGTSSDDSPLIWNTTETGRWLTEGAGVSDDIFWQNDYVIFNDLTGAQYINATQAVTVSGMEINGGDYVFSGSAISAPASIDDMEETDYHKVTGTVAVSGSETTATFSNLLTGFDKITVADGSTVTFIANGNVSSAATAIENDGHIIYNRGSNTTLNNVISGVGRVTKQDDYTMTISNQNTATGTFDQMGGNVVFANNSSWEGNYHQNIGGLVLNTGTSIGGDFFQSKVAETFNAADGVTIGKNSGSTSTFGSKIILNGTLNVGGDLVFNGALWNLSLTGEDESHNMNVTGEVDFIDPSSINLNTWQVGEYAIIVSGTAGGINYTDGKFGSVTVNDMTVGSRQSASLHLSEDGGTLYLVTGSQNMDLLWTGTGSGAWNTTSINNWKVYPDGVTEQFNQDDYVYFDGAGANQTITVGGSGVQVSGMKVTDGDYTFEGSAITGVEPTFSTGQTITGKLEVEGGKATFKNTVSFVKGIDISENAEVELGDDGSFGSTAISNAGTLTFNLSEDYSYTQNGTIAGTAGSVIQATGQGTFTLGGTQTSTGSFVQTNGQVNLNTDWLGNYEQTGGRLSVAANKSIGGHADLSGAVELKNVVNVNTLNLNGATVEIIVNAGASDGYLASAGAITFGAQSTIDLSVYETGTYTILTSGLTNGIDYTNGDFTVTAGGQSLGNRQSYEIELIDNGTKLVLTTTSKSLNLVWTGADSSQWTVDSEVTNWKNSEPPEEEDAFNPMDYVIFDDTGLAAGTVTIADDTVVVAGMKIETTGTYTFEGGAITSPDPAGTESSGQNVTGSLDVVNGKAIFKNALDFAEGMNISAPAEVTLADGAGLAETMDITNEGLLIVDRSLNDLILLSDITGAGDLQKDGTAQLTLGGDAAGATGDILHNAGGLMLVQTWGGNYIQNDASATLIGGDGATIAGNAEVTGTLETAGAFNIGGDLLLDGATLKISVNRNGQSDVLNVTGSVDFDAPTTLNLRNWKDSAAGYEIVTAGTLNYNAGDIDESNILINGMPVGSRQEIEFEVIGDSLWVSGTTDNMDIEWAGGNGNWNTTEAKWLEAGTANPEQYNTNDYVVFNNNETATITVQGDGAQVSGMLVSDGIYTFTGAEIVGNNDASTTGHTVTGKLEVTNDAHAIFENSIDFIDGMDIDTDATVTVADGGLLAEAMDIDNLGSLVFDRTEDYDFNNTLTGNGDVVQNGTGLLTVSGDMAAAEGDLLHNLGGLKLAAEWGGNYVQGTNAGTFTAADNSQISGNAALTGNVELEGQLTVTGDTNLDGATINYSNLGETNAGKIVSGTITFGDAINTVNVNAAAGQKGTYVIMEATSIDDITNKFGAVLIDGAAIGNRQKAELKLNDVSTQLELVMAVDRNLDLIWTGGADGKWYTKHDTTADTANWLIKETGNNDEFIAYDYVIFDETADRFNVTVDGDRATVSGMLVNGGDYVFSGSTIVGLIGEQNGQTVTGLLEIAAGSATFNNAIDFVNGVEIAGGAALIMANGTDFAATMDVVNEGFFYLGKGDTTFASLSGTGGVVSFHDLGDTLYITNDLSGSQTFANLEINMTEGWADRIEIGGDVEGSHKLDLNISGDINARVDTEAIGAIVTALNNKASGTISADDFEFGAFRYGIHTNDDFTWEVYRIGMGSAGQAILNTHAAVNSAFFGQLDNVNKRMGDLRLNGYKNNGNFWVRAYGRHINGDLDIKGVNKFKEDTYGVDMGVDILASTYTDAAFYFGGFGGYARSDRSFKKTSGTDGDSDSVYGGFYGTWVHDGWYVDGVVKAQYFKSSFNARGDKGDFDNYALGMSIEVGKHILVNDFFLEPSLQVAYAYVANEDYTTSRGLKVKADDANVFQFAGMVRAGADLQTDNGIIQPYVKVGFEAQSSSGGHVNFSGERFRPEMDGIRAVFGAGVVWQLDDSVQLHLDYEGAFGSKYNRPFGISAGVRITF